MSDTGEFITQNVPEEATAIAFREMERQLAALKQDYIRLIEAVHHAYHLQDRSTDWKECKSAICRLIQIKLEIHRNWHHEQAPSSSTPV
jgi:hypothetical protein